MNFFEQKKIVIENNIIETPFQKPLGICQDGTTPMYRDVDGKLWAMSGHSHVGHIAMFSGSCVADLEQLYAINTNFCVGHADYAFSGVRYPEGVKPRGSIWPFGLYICPKTHRFFCFFHNETGWNGKGTGYDALGFIGQGEIPRCDSDFRHIGLMHSDDEGKNWTFDRWVLSGSEVCISEKFNPDNENLIGQQIDKLRLGTGDFTLFVNPNDDYIYLLYNIVGVNMNAEKWTDCHTYIARTRKRTDGAMGDFVKYYEGSFCEAGNLGRESVIIPNSWHTRMVWLEKYKKYLVSYRALGAVNPWECEQITEFRVSDDMINWSEPVTVMLGDAVYGNHYSAIVPNDTVTQANVIAGDDFSILSNRHSPVNRYLAHLEDNN